MAPCSSGPTPRPGGLAEWTLYSLLGDELSAQHVAAWPDTCAPGTLGGCLGDAVSHTCCLCSLCPVSASARLPVWLNPAHLCKRVQMLTRQLPPQGPALGQGHSRGWRHGLAGTCRCRREFPQCTPHSDLLETVTPTLKANLSLVCKQTR